MKLCMFFLIAMFSLFSECKEKLDLFFLQIEQNLNEVQKINKDIGAAPKGSDKRLTLIIKKEEIIGSMQGRLYTDILQKKISSMDPRACDKLLVVKKLLESLDQMKGSSDNKWADEFENILSSLKLLLNPSGVCPKEGKRPRKYKVEKYL
jgi:hypothetical protein